MFRSLSIPLSYRMLFSLRIGFILLFCPVYFFEQADTLTWKDAFVIITLILFTANNFLYYRIKRIKTLLMVASLDFLAASSYGFVFLGGNLPDQTIMGLVGMILFLRIQSRILLSSWLAIIVVYWAVLLTMELQWIGKIDIVGIIVNTSFIIFLSFIGSLIRFYQDARNEAAELNEQLREYAKQIEGFATAKERNRIAREIHDSIGHMLTSLLLQLQVTRKLHPIDLKKSYETLLKSEQLARAALQELRLSVRAMRDEDWREHVFLESLQTLINDFSAITDMNITFHSSGSIKNIVQPVQLSIFRVVQEFLTNAHKHGNANLTTINLHCDDEKLEIILKDNGSGADEIIEGVGLKSMKDRVEEHGGRISISSNIGRGFEVKIVIDHKIFLHKEIDHGTRLSG